MKRSGRMLSAGLAVATAATVFALAGCGGSPGGDPGTIRIVSSLPRTGSAQGQTDTIVNGIRMAIDEAGGTVAGFKIDYRDMDDATAAAGEWTAEAETANAQKAAADPDVMVFIGPYNSGAAKMSMPILNDAGILQISPAATWPGLTKPGFSPAEPLVYRPSGKLTFCRVVPTDDIQAPVAALFAKNELKAKKVFLLDDTQVYGKGLADLFAKVAPEIGLEVLGRESINEKAQEFGALMSRIKGMNPDVVYFGGTTQTKGGQIAKDMVKAGLNIPMIGPDGCYEKSFITSAGAENVNGRAYLTFGGPDPTRMTGAGKKFVDEYKKKYGNMPEAYALYGYESAKAAFEAIKKAGKKDREAIRVAGIGIKDFDQGAAGKWSFDENGDTTLPIFTVSKIENGDFQPVREYTGDDLRSLKK